VVVKQGPIQISTWFRYPSSLGIRVVYCLEDERSRASILLGAAFALYDSARTTLSRRPISIAAYLDVVDTIRGSLLLVENPRDAEAVRVLLDRFLGFSERVPGVIGHDGVHAVKRGIVGVSRVSIVSIRVSIRVVGSICAYTFLLVGTNW
jgi:hypothetical protein